MIFKTLQLENIRSFEKTNIKFSLGTSLFEGDIGSGKSTILMAIEFALFGLGNQKGDSLLRKKTNIGSVIFKFEVDNKKCEVKRNLIRKGTNGPVRQGKGYLSINGTNWHLSPTEIKEKILELLNFNEPLNPRAQSVIFRYAVYTPQEEMGYILSQKPDIRLQILRKAFGIEDYKIATENAETISHNIKNKIIYLEGQTSDINEKKKRINDLTEQKEKNELNLTELIENGENCQKRLEIREKELEELEKSESYIKQVKVQIPHLKKQIEDKNQLLTKYIKEIEDLEKENESKLINQIQKLENIEKPTMEQEESLNKKNLYLKKLVNTRNEFVIKLSLLKENKGDIENWLKDHRYTGLNDLKKDKENFISQIEQKNSLIKEKEIFIKSISEDKNKLKGKKQDIQDKLDDLEGLGDLCPICGSKLNEEHKKNLKTERETIISSLNKKILELEKHETTTTKELKSHIVELENLKKNLESLKFITNKVAELSDLEGKIDFTNEKLKNLDSKIILIIENVPEFKELEDYLNYFENLLNKLREFNRNLEDLKTLKYRFEKNKYKITENKEEINKINVEIDVLKEARSKFKAKSEELKDILDKLLDVKSDYKKMDKNFQLIKEKTITTKTVIKSMTKDIQNIQDELEQKENLKKQYNKLCEYHIWLNDYLIPTLSLIEKHVMQQNQQQFNENFKKWFELLIDDSTKTGKINEEFTPIIEQDGFEQEINYLSGGEKTSVALAYRLALNIIVQAESAGMESNLLILDEPTDGFSKEQLYKVRDILNELDCPQIILVSHERELESFADNIFRVEKVDGISKVTSRG